MAHNDEADPASSRQAFLEALKRCEQEPIHLAGAIQSHGALCGLDGNWRIRMVSANLGDYWGIAVASLLEQPAETVFGGDFIAALQSAKLPGEQEEALSLTVPFQPDGHDAVERTVMVHGCGGLTVVEFCPDDAPGRASEQRLLPLLRKALWAFDREESLLGYCSLVAEEIRELTGFDRVKIYCFDHKWDGEVIAESRNDVLPSLLGNHFPASDIPPQARALYEKNLIRVLEDSEAVCVSLLPAMNPLTGAPFDMSFSVLRSMSPIHLEYLRNMGVRATVTVSLMLGKRLWGLIACHHATPRHVSFEMRELIEFVGKTVSLKLASLAAATQTRYMEQIRESLLALTQTVRNAGEVEQITHRLEAEIISVCGASGCFIKLGKQFYRIGLTPNTTQIEGLTAWLRDGRIVDGIFQTEALGEVYPPAQEYQDIASGLLTFALDAKLNDCIYWFRAEVIRNISWAGNPAKQLVEDGIGPRINPRRSFSKWMQTARGQARPWSPIEIDAVKVFSLSLVQLLMQKALIEAEEHIREITDTLGEGVYVLDESGFITFANPESAKLLGRSSDELIGRLAHDLFHSRRGDGKPLAIADCPLHAAMLRGETFKTDAEFFWRKDGSAFPVSINATPIFRKGKLSGSVVAFHDITEHVEALKKDKLLIHQSRLAAMGEMIGNIAHQWRQPLNAMSLVLGYIHETHRRGQLDEKKLEDSLARGNRLLQKMSTTIDDFRDFFRPHKQVSRFSLRAALDDCLTLIEASIRNNRIGLIISAPEEVFVEGYPNEFSQALLNLIGNAKDACLAAEGGGRTISVEIFRCDEYGCLVVCDDAGGVAKDVMERLFEPYFTTKVKGTGIGLYMTKLIIENMNGSITAENAGNNARFTLCAPLAR